MPRYFFDFHDGTRRTLDVEGLDLDGSEDLEREVMSALSQAFQYDSVEGQQRLIECHVRDDSGKVVYCAALDLKGRWVDAKL